VGKKRIKHLDWSKKTLLSCKRESGATLTCDWDWSARTSKWPCWGEVHGGRTAESTSSRLMGRTSNREIWAGAEKGRLMPWTLSVIRYQAEALSMVSDTSPTAR